MLNLTGIKQPRVCVAICNYNHELYLSQSIQSIVDQTYQDLDIVIVDDGSSDRLAVRRIIESFKNDTRIRYIELQENKGKWHCLNLAFSTTSCDICTSHDADDVSLPWRIESQVGALLQTNTLHNMCGFLPCWSEDDIDKAIKIKRPDQMNVMIGENVAKMVMLGFEMPNVNHYFTGEFATAGVSALFYKKLWDLGFRFMPPNQGLRVLTSEDSDFNFRVTTALRSTSLLLERPYLYRRYTGTNKEEK